MFRAIETSDGSDPLYVTQTEPFPIEGMTFRSNLFTVEEMDGLVEYLDSRCWTHRGFPPRRQQRYERTGNGFVHATDEKKYQCEDTCPLQTVLNRTESIIGGRHERWSITVEEYIGPNSSSGPRRQGGGKSTVAELCLLDHSFRSIHSTESPWSSDSVVFFPKGSLLVMSSRACPSHRYWTATCPPRRTWKKAATVADIKSKGDSKGSNTSPPSQKLFNPVQLPDGMGTFHQDRDYRSLSIVMMGCSDDGELPFHIMNKSPVTSTSTTQTRDERVGMPQPLPPAGVFDCFPPLPELLTVVITTSPIKSNPSTELLEKVTTTFRLAGSDFCQCPRVIICDGVRRSVNSNVNSTTLTKAYSNVKQSLRNGIVDEDQEKDYAAFKDALHKLCSGDKKDDDGNGHVLRGTKVVELEERHGYGHALREAILHHVHTPYVCVVQHDRTFMRRTPVREVVHAMKAACSSCSNTSTPIRYVGFSMRSNLLYKDVYLSKYGREALNELESMVLQPPQLTFVADSKDNVVYGPHGSSIRDMFTSYRDRKKLRDNLAALRDTYRSSTHGAAFGKGFAVSLKEGVETVRMELTPTLFWYDNVHVAETAFYRDTVFDRRRKLVARGGFVEDKLSPAILRSVESHGLVEGHALFGCYLLDDGSGAFFTGHLDGGCYLTDQQKAEFQDQRRGL